MNSSTRFNPNTASSASPLIQSREVAQTEAVAENRPAPDAAAIESGHVPSEAKNAQAPVDPAFLSATIREARSTAAALDHEAGKLLAAPSSENAKKLLGRLHALVDQISVPGLYEYKEKDIELSATFGVVLGDVSQAYLKLEDAISALKGEPAAKLARTMAELVKGELAFADLLASLHAVANPKLEQTGVTGQVNQPLAGSLEALKRTAWAHYNKGKVEKQRGNTEAAEAHFTRALADLAMMERGAKDDRAALSVAHNRSGMVHHQRGEETKALERYAQALSINEGNYPPASYNSACASAALGKTEDALRHLHDAVTKGSASTSDTIRNIAASDPDLKPIAGQKIYLEAVAPAGGPRFPLTWQETRARLLDACERANVRWHVDLPAEWKDGVKLSSIPAEAWKLADLRGADLRGVDLEGVDLRGLDLSGARFDGAQLDRVKLSGANLRGASLVSALTRECDLTGADLRNANLSASHHVSLELTGARLESASMRDLRLTWCTLAGLDLTGQDLQRARIEASDLTGAKLDRANLAHAVFEGEVKLAGARLNSADLSHAHIEYTYGRGALDLSGAELEGAKLRGIVADGALILHDARARGADLTGLRVQSRADFTGAHLEDAKLERIQLDQFTDKVRFDGAHLRGAKISFIGKPEEMHPMLLRAMLEKADTREAELDPALRLILRAGSESSRAGLGPTSSFSGTKTLALRGAFGEAGEVALDLTIGPRSLNVGGTALPRGFGIVSQIRESAFAPPETHVYRIFGPGESDRELQLLFVARYPQRETDPVEIAHAPGIRVSQS